MGEKVTHIGVFWEGHHFRFESPHSEKLVCKHCGAVTSYAQFVAVGSKIDSCPRYMEGYGEPMLDE